MANLSNINNKFLVTTGGNVLIGQTAVVGTSILQVEGSTNAIIRMNSTAGTGGRMDFAYGGSNYGNIGSGKNILGTGNAADMMINADSLLILGVGSQDMTILPSGNVGIGTPSPDAKLEVEGDVNSGFFSVYAKNTNAGSSAYVSKKWLNNDAGFGEIWRNSSARNAGAGNTESSFNMYNSNDIHFWSSGIHTMALVNNNVGIGTPSPATSYGFSRTLEIQGAANAEINISQSNNSKDWSLGIVNGANYQQTTSGQDYIWIIGGSEKMRIASNGRVGIGTNTPVALLHLKQAAGANIRFENGTTNRVCTVGEGVGTNDVFSFRGNSYRSTDTLSVVFSTDRVGIGTISPGTKLDVNGAGSTGTISWANDGGRKKRLFI